MSFSRKILAGFVLIIVALPMLSGLLWMANGLVNRITFPTHEQVTIQINKAELIWIKSEREASVKGKMFDVKSFQKTGNSFLLTGYFDEQEDDLFSFLNSLLSGENVEDAFSTQFLGVVFFPMSDLAANSIDHDESLIVKPSFSYTGSELLNRSAEVLSPPPNS